MSNRQTIIEPSKIDPKIRDDGDDLHKTITPIFF